MKKCNECINEELNFRNPNKKNIKNYSEMNSNDVDPLDDDNLPLVLIIAKKQSQPYEKITSLDCSDRELNNLDGIENLINLQMLYCHDNNLTNLEGIENLIDLKFLDCDNNNFSEEYKQRLSEYCKNKKIDLSI